MNSKLLGSTQEKQEVRVSFSSIENSMPGWVKWQPVPKTTPTKQKQGPKSSTVTFRPNGGLTLPCVVSLLPQPIFEIGGG